ncbi:MAG TPA: NAD(P)H-dependent oxidoreductase [Polyangiaceae bacterium]|nr:NAD(P)H-dependent oxidoreductase [Polyangiaceae bacterium]
MSVNANLTLHFLALCGSLRRVSSNLSLLRAALLLELQGVDLRLAEPLDRLPHFNPDLDEAPYPEAVLRWREEIAAADAVILCSPEYAFSLPGVLKNALDWLVPSGELYEKPVAVLTAAPNQRTPAKAQRHLLETLSAQQVRLVQEASVTVTFPRDGFDARGALTDPEAAARLRAAIEALAAAVRSPPSVAQGG